MKKQTKHWTTKSGEKIRICDMLDEHLKNTIAFLERNARFVADVAIFPSFQGEMAQYYAEQQYDNMVEDPIEFFCVGTIYDDLVTEQLRRGLL